MELTAGRAHGPRPCSRAVMIAENALNLRPAFRGRGVSAKSRWNNASDAKEGGGIF